MQGKTKAQVHPLAKLAIDIGPLVVFFLTNAKAGIFYATAAFMAAIVVAVAVAWRLEKRVPVLPLVTSVFVLVFGGLTLILQDELFIKLKPTIINTLFGLILLLGLALKRNFLKAVAGHALQLEDPGWRQLTFRWVFFLFLSGAAQRICLAQLLDRRLGQFQGLRHHATDLGFHDIAVSLDQEVHDRRRSDRRRLRRPRMSDLILLDGGMGSELEKRDLALGRSIWSGFALRDYPGQVTEIHGRYIAAGADVIITSNYGIVPVMLAKEGLEDRLGELTETAVACANEARDRGGRAAVRIAGSLPPLNMSYRPDMVDNDEILVTSYRAIAAALAPGVDLFVTETLSTVREAVAAAKAVAGFGHPIWISWSLDKAANGTLRSGEGLAAAVAALRPYPVAAFLFNCCSVEAIAAGLPILRQLTDRPIGAYANAFGRLPRKYVMGESKLGHRTDLGPEPYLTHCQDWRAAGASIIGGCCGIGPDHVRLLDKELRTAA